MAKPRRGEGCAGVSFFAECDRYGNPEQYDRTSSRIALRSRSSLLNLQTSFFVPT